MSTMIQVSPKDNLGTLYNIKSEGDEPEVTWADFGAILNLAGGPELAQKVRNTLVAVLSAGAVQPAADPLANAVATVTATFPGATQVPQVPAAAAAPVAPGAAPVCQHGQQTLVVGQSKKPPFAEWRAWGCPARKDDTTKCGLSFIRG